MLENRCAELQAALAQAQRSHGDRLLAATAEAERTVGAWASRCETAEQGRRGVEARFHAMQQQLNDRTADVRLLRQQLANSEEQLGGRAARGQAAGAGGASGAAALPRASRALNAVKARQQRARA
jgi:hypothetical protein